MPIRNYPYGRWRIGRIDTTADRKNGILHVKGLWWEEGVRQTKKLNEILERTVRRFARFNNTNVIEYEY